MLFCASGSSLTEEHFRTVEWAVRNRSSVEALPPQMPVPDTAAARREDQDSLNLRDHVDGLEKELIEAALAKRTGGNKSQAAELLGVTRAGLAMKIRRLFKAEAKGGMSRATSGLEKDPL